MRAPQTPRPPAGNQWTGRRYRSNAIASILQNFQNAGNGGAGGAASGTGATPDLGAISKLTGILNSFNQSDKNVELLRALKPHFSPARASKIDDAVRIMQLIHAWPSVRDSGLLGSLGNLFSGGIDRNDAMEQYKDVYRGGYDPHAARGGQPCA